VSIKGKILRKSFQGVNNNIWKNLITYSTTPNDAIEITSVSPYGQGTLCYDYNNNKVYYKTSTDSTDWVELP